MGNESGEWIMKGIPEEDPACLHTAEELSAYVEEVGFLPLFENPIPGFSAEEHCDPRYWWTGDRERDPWEWRIRIAADHRIAYGKFFGGRAGFISREWLPVFANYRRRGYDFDALWDDGFASYREKKIMDCFLKEKEFFSFRLKREAGFKKDGEKNFEGTLTGLQDKLYLTVADFRRRLNKKGLPYGWHVTVYAAPETLFGEDTVTKCYGEDPAESYRRIIGRMRRLYPSAADADLERWIGGNP